MQSRAPAALALLLLAVGATARTLKQDTAAAIWKTYSLEPHTFYVSLTMLPQVSKETPEACAEACLADPKCQFWSWCPGSASAGCAIAGQNGTTASTLTPKTCLLSYDTSADSLAVFSMYGEAGTVDFMGGMYQPPKEDKAASGPVKIDVPGVGARRRSRALLQLDADQPPTPGDPVWQDYTYELNRFYAGVDRLGWATVDTPEACAAQCKGSAPDCQFYAFCPKGASGGCAVPSQGGAPPTMQPAGTCITTGDKLANRTAVFNVLGEGVKWVGGTYAPGNKPPPANATATAGAATGAAAGAGTTAAAAGAPPTPNPEDPAAWVDPSPDGPKECQGWFSGNQWGDEEIECHMCGDGEYQLKCDYDSGLLWTREEINCEFDRAGLGSLANNAIEFSCEVDQKAVPPSKCNWEELRSKLPGCAYEPVRRILTTWKPN